MAVCGLVPANQRFVQQGRQPLEGVQADSLGVTHGFGSLERPPPDEHRQPGEQASLDVVQEVVAPGDGPAKGPLALRKGSDPRGEDGETLLEPRQYLLGRQDLRPGGRQLDGQGQAVEAGGDLRHGAGVLLRHPEPGPHLDGPLGKKPDRFEPAEGEDVREPLGVGGFERWHRILLLTAERQHHARGDQGLQLRGCREEFFDHRACRRHLFEVVDDQEELLIVKMGLHGFEDGAAGNLWNPEGLSNGRGNQRGVGHRREVDEEGAISVLGQDLGGNLKGQSGLPGPPGAGEREEACPAEELPDLGYRVLPAYERCQLQRQVVRPGVQGPGRRKVRGEPLDHQVVEVLGVSDVLQPMLSEIPEGSPVWKRALHESPGGVGEDDLPSVGRGGYPRGPVHVDADVVVPAPHPLPGVKSHPDPHAGARGPIVGGQAPLGGHGGPDRPRRVGKHKEEGVPLGADLDTAALRGGLANDRGVLVLDEHVSITELLEQAG
jgi:hypothetical protein